MGEFHQKLLQSFTNFKNKYLKAADGLVFKFTKDPGGSGKYGYLNSNGEFVPFKTAHTLTRTITAGTSSKTTDMGEDHEYRYIKTNPTPSQTKTVTGSRSAQTVTPDSGYLLSSVTVNKYPDATGTYGTITSNGTHDMGTTNNYRYVGVDVKPSVSKAWAVANNYTINTVVGGYYFVTIFEADHFKNFTVAGATVINRSGRVGAMNSGKGGSIELFYLRATSTSVSIYDTPSGSWIFCIAAMRVK